MMKLIGVIVMLVLSVVTARSCSSGSSSSPVNPATVEQNGLSGLCANQSAVADASGQTPSQTLPDVPGLAAAAGAAGLPAGSFSCPTTTLAPGS